MKQRIYKFAALALVLIFLTACGGSSGDQTNDSGGGLESLTPNAGVNNDNTSATLTDTPNQNTNPDQTSTPDQNDNLNQNDSSDPTSTPNQNDNFDQNDNRDQSEDPSQGEADKGDAVGSTDEGLDELGGGFKWRREGGIAGFCDIVIVLAGTATVASCAIDPPRIVGEVSLTAAQSRQMMTWIEDLQTFENQQSDGAVADGMTIHLIFEGEGDDEPTDKILDDIEALANEILADVNGR